MKRLVLFFAALTALSLADAENVMSLSITSAHPGDTVTITLSLSNSDLVTAMQAFVPLGSQLSYIAGSATLSTRSNGHTIAATVLNDTLRIYSYSISMNCYTGNSGALLSFRLVLGNEPATYNLPLCSARMSSLNYTALALQTTSGSVTILAPKIHLGTSSLDYGHCPIRSSYSRTVSIHNVGNEPLTLSGVSFDDSTLTCQVPNVTIAAGNQQSVTINYLPVTAGVVSRQGLFHSNANVGDSNLAIAADPYAVNELRPLAVAGYTDSIVTVQLRMNNMDSIVALQTAIKLPDALTYIEGSFSVDSSRGQGHIATAGLLGDTLKMMITSLQNNPLRGGDGVVASFQLRLHGYGSHTLRLLNTILSDTAARNVTSAVYTGLLNIYSPTIICNSTLDMGNSPVTDTAMAIFTINNTGNAPLVIDHIAFTVDSFSVEEAMPIVVDNNQNVTLHIRYTGMQAGIHSALMQIYNNDPRSTLKQVPLTCFRFDPNILYMSGNPNNEVDNASVSIMLDNYSTITALQMDVEYPYHYATMGSGDFLLTSRSNGHIVSSARQNDSTWRVLMFSMQNLGFIDNSGSVLDFRMHLIDTNDMGQYPIMLHNVRVAGVTGVNLLSSLDSVVYIATRIQVDTMLVHDTISMTIYDTVYQTEFIHDTTTITVYADTAYLTEYIHDTVTFTVYEDTLYYWQHDTTVVVQYDTVLVDNFIYDTSYVQIHDTTYLWLHDTTYIEVYIHDTTDIHHYIHDTTFVTIHDTTHTTVYIHDTIVEPIVFHDLSVGSNNLERGVGVGSGHFPEGSVVEIAGIPTAGNKFLQWADGGNDNPRTVTLTQDMNLQAVFVSINPNYIENDLHQWTLHTNGMDLVIDNLMGEQIRIIDIQGRILENLNSVVGTHGFRFTSFGTYFVQIGNAPAKKVVIVR